MASALRIHARAVRPQALAAGRDLVLDRWAPGDLPDRVLLDDWLPEEDRERIDREAREMLQAFAAQHGEALRFDGLDLVDAWWWELLSEVFVWELRIAAGVERAVTALRPARIEWHGVDREQRASLEATVGRRGTPKGEEPSGPIYPSSFGVGSRPNARGRLARNAALALGIPGLARGNVLVHGSLGSTLAATAAGCAFTIVLDPRNLSGLRVRTLASIAARGGWIGAPSLGRRVLARRRLESSLRRLEGRITASHGEPLERFLARRAAELLRQLAAITIADHRVARRALAHGGLRAIVLPFDTPPGARGLIQAARQAGVPALVVQHGFASGAGFIHDGSEGDVAAVWSDADAELLRPHARGRVAVTGNPGVEQLLGQVGQMPTMPRGRGRSLVLVEYPFRVSTRIDSRVKHRQVLTALHALAATRSGTEVIIRPHPGDHEPRALEPIAAMFPGIHVRIDSASPIPGLLDECDLLVAALSTAALEAGARGIPVIFLNSLGLDVNPPFDGSGDLPAARSQDELVALIPAVLAAPHPPGLEEMRVALGMRVGATAAVASEIERLVAG